MPDEKASGRIKALKDRAYLLRQARDFFYERRVCEVDCPILSASAAIDAHIDLITANCQGSNVRYLHSSPEFGMKRLLSEGIGDIYQLSHVFRDGEWGVKHNPEFMMAEWYRVGFTLERLIDETIQFIHLFLGDLPYAILSYRDAFQRYAGFDYVTATCEELFAYVKQENISFYPAVLDEGKDALLNLILGSKIEPRLGQNELTVIAYYPSSQAALAQKCRREEEDVAERFEVYYRGVELANGYHELANADEQRARFLEANQLRVQLGKSALPIDENFLKALESLPDCSGVAVGFDRLMMLRNRQDLLSEAISWGWDVA